MSTTATADLIDIPSLIESRDDALTALAERDAEIERLTVTIERQAATITELLETQNEMFLRLAEYRSVNMYATRSLERYAARFGALS